MLAIGLVAVFAALAPTSASAAPIGTLDSSCAPGSSAGFVPIWSGTTAAQTFTAGMTGKLRYVEVVNVSRAVGGTGGPIDVDLLAVDGTGTPVTPALATTSIPQSEITPGSSQTLTATFPSADAHPVVSGSSYAIALRTADNAQNVWVLGVDTCGGKVFQSYGGPFGTPFFTSGEDAGLRTYVTPPNDDFDDSAVLEGSVASANGTTVGSTEENGDVFFAQDQFSIGKSVWYRWTAPGGGTTTADTCTTDFDSLLAVFSGQSRAELVRLTENNNACPTGFGSRLSFDAVAGTTYRFQVDGCCGLPQGAFTLAVEGAEPTTDLTSGPTGLTNDPTPTFGLGSNYPNATFECSVDAATPAACSGPGATHTTPPLGDGAHQLAAHAIDDSGRADPSPATQGFVVDTVAPETEITRAPKRRLITAKRKKALKVRFESEAGADFECRLQRGSWKACSSPFEVTLRSRAGKGRKYRIGVRAIDEAGNVEPKAEVARFKLIRKG